MSVLSRPTRHTATTETQREAKLPLQRTSPEPQSTTTARPSQLTRPAPQSRRTRVTLIAGGGLVVALAVGVGTFAVLDDDGGTVVAPAVVNVPDAADLGRDAAAAGRGPDAGAVAGSAGDAGRISEAQRDAALARRAQHLRPEAFAGTTSVRLDAAQLSEARRDAALARRAQSFQP